MRNCCDGVATILFWGMDRWARWLNSVNNSILKFRTLRGIVAATSIVAPVSFMRLFDRIEQELEQRLSVYVSWRWLWKFALRAYDKPVWVLKRHSTSGALYWSSNFRIWVCHDLGCEMIIPSLLGDFWNTGVCNMGENKPKSGSDCRVPARKPPLKSPCSVMWK